MAVIQPADDLETAGAVEYAARRTRARPSCARRARSSPRVNNEGYKFELGKGVTLVDGKDLTIVASGGTVGPRRPGGGAAGQGRHQRARHQHPHHQADRRARCWPRPRARPSAILTVEDHQITGGLGGAVCEALAERRAGAHPPPRHPGRVRRIGHARGPLQALQARRRRHRRSRPRLPRASSPVPAPGRESVRARPAWLRLDGDSVQASAAPSRLPPSARDRRRPACRLRQTGGPASG